LNNSKPEDGTIPFEIGLAGKGLPGVGEWSPSNLLVLTQDASNKFLFYAQMNLTAGTKVEFTITPKHSWGWWLEPFWRFENGDTDSKENEFNTKNTGHNMTTVTVKNTGKYMFKFDTHLLRSRLYLID
jgi:plastocyanin